MEPLGQPGVTGGCVMGQEETMVASVRSVMKEMQGSIHDLCKDSLAKIITIGQLSSPLLSSSPHVLSSHLISSPLLNGQNFLFAVNNDPPASVPNGAEAEGPLPAPAQNAGMITSSATGTHNLVNC